MPPTFARGQTVRFPTFQTPVPRQYQTGVVVDVDRAGPSPVYVVQNRVGACYRREASALQLAP